MTRRVLWLINMCLGALLIGMMVLSLYGPTSALTTSAGAQITILPTTPPTSTAPPTTVPPPVTTAPVRTVPPTTAFPPTTRRTTNPTTATTRPNETTRTTTANKAPLPTLYTPYTGVPYVGTTVAPTTSSTTSTTIAGITGQIPINPVTVPLETHGTSAHVSPVFGILSGAGFLAALLIVATRLFLTSPRIRRSRT